MSNLILRGLPILESLTTVGRLPSFSATGVAGPITQKETRQIRRQRERLLAKTSASPTSAAVLLNKNGLRRFRDLARQVRNEQHLQEILASVPDADRRAKFFAQVKPFLHFRVSDNEPCVISE